MIILCVTLGLVGLALGLLIGWLIGSRQGSAACVRAESSVESLRGETAGLQNELRLERDRSRELTALRADLDARLRLAQEGLTEERARIEEMQEQFRETFRALSGDALQTNREEFLKLADRDLKNRQEAIDALLKPMKDTLERVDRAHAQDHSVLAQNLEKLLRSTSGLETALRRPQVRGSWGEMILENVARLAGMSEYCDFDRQVSTSTADGRLRPDMIVRLPGERLIIVDSKVPLEHFRQAAEAAGDEERNRLMQLHAAAVRTHMQGLSRKEYWKQFTQPTPDFVILFLPGESFFSAALELDRTLIEDGIQNHVLLATPTTLIAMLRTIAYSWQQQQREVNVMKIAEAGAELYDRLCVFAEHLADIHVGLERANQAYNSAVGSFNSRVVPGGRTLADLGAGHIQKQLDDVPPMESSLREPPAPPQLPEGSA